METSIKQDHVPQADLPGQIRPGLRLGFLFADASWESWKTPRLSLREHAVGSVRGESFFFGVEHPYLRGARLPLR